LGNRLVLNGEILQEAPDHQRLAFELGHDPIVTAKAFYGVLKLKRGYPKQGLQLLPTAVDTARRSGHGLTIAYVLNLKLLLDILLEDHAELESTSAALENICDKRHIPQHRP
jgi:hypothetical protein